MVFYTFTKCNNCLIDFQKEDECKISNSNYIVLFQFNFQFQKV